MDKQQKEILRKVYLEKRRTLTEEEFAKRNQLINQRVIKLISELGLHTIHLFFAIKKFKEVDLNPLLQWGHENSRTFVASVSDLKKASMQHFYIKEDTVLELNKWGIPEPVKAKEASLDLLDAVLVPMVIGNKRGDRIGYGKGYYDTFLKECPAHVKFIGLNLGPLLEQDAFSEPHDIKMDYMLTPFELFHIKTK